MYRYNIEELFKRFDVRSAVVGEPAVTGRLSAFIGEELLLDVLAHALTAEGHEVVRIPGHPHRDDAEFKAAGASLPEKCHDLDAWLLLGHQLVAVECKHWTSSSRDYRSVPQAADEVKAHALKEWHGTIEKIFTQDLWNSVTKIALPLKQPPTNMPTSWPKIRRILAIWTPVSWDGNSAFSTIASRTLSGGRFQPVTIDVFSASLYLRHLRSRGETHLTPIFPDMVERLLAALDILFET
jgi:hypothetical protein